MHNYGVDVDDLADEYPRFTLAEIVRRWGVPRPTLTLAIRNGRLPAEKQDNRYVVRGGDLAAWMEVWQPRKRQEKEE